MGRYVCAKVHLCMPLHLCVQTYAYMFIYVHVYLCVYACIFVHVCASDFSGTLASPNLIWSRTLSSFLLILISPKTISLSSVSLVLKTTPALHLPQTGWWRRHRPVSTNLFPCGQEQMAKMTIQVKPGCASFLIFSLWINSRVMITYLGEWEKWKKKLKWSSKERCTGAGGGEACGDLGNPWV